MPTPATFGNMATMATFATTTKFMNSVRITITGVNRDRTGGTLMVPPVFHSTSFAARGMREKTRNSISLRRVNARTPTSPFKKHHRRDHSA
jgi:hypothetical protein